MNRRFEYELVNLNDYSEEDIMSFGDALSFVLLVDKVRDSEGKNALTCLPSDYEEKLRLHIPENLSKLIVNVVLCLLGKKGFNRLEAGQVAEIADKADRKEYGGMFEAVIESFKESIEEGILKGREEWLQQGLEKGLLVGREEGLHLGQEKGIQLGLEKGAQEERLRAVPNFKKLGVSPEIIAQATGLSVEEVKGM